MIAADTNILVRLLTEDHLTSLRNNVLRKEKRMENLLILIASWIGGAGLGVA
jgi:predicted nucleic-acid-binding protein